MRDAMGGSVVLIIIVVFIVITLGYMAFNVNYTKAFRMKNKVISVYEDYKGTCESTNKSFCEKELKEYAKSIGYSSNNNLNCKDDYQERYNLYCVKKLEVSEQSDELINESKSKSYYRVMTKINVDIPVIRNILDLRFFYITGDTKTFEE